VRGDRPAIDVPLTIVSVRERLGQDTLLELVLNSLHSRARWRSETGATPQAVAEKRGADGAAGGGLAAGAVRGGLLDRFEQHRDGFLLFFMALAATAICRSLAVELCCV
jgi:hypothetical protein